MGKNSSDIGTDTETKAGRKLRQLFGKEAYIKKMPDFKQTGSMSGGLPDYMVIWKKQTIWFEIKHVDNKKKSISFSNFTNQQVIEFRRMVDAGAKVHVIIYFGNDMNIVRWDEILKYMKTSKRKSIPRKTIMRWTGNG